MATDDARRHARELAGMADELTICLRVLEELRATVNLGAAVLPAKPDEDVSALGAINAADAGAQDIMALAFIVIMEASKSAREDLKAIMAKVKAINEAKERWRHEADEINECASSRAAMTASGPDGADMDSLLEILLAAHWISTQEAIDQLRDDIDSMSEMGEMESLRLQMAMDRLSKMMSTLSNLLKKLADTQQQLVQNLK